MRSKDLAARAGVTVRTLRHYHQIGLMPEPARDANGYRRYGIQHLIRLLRIGRLTALGLSLRQLAPLLDRPDAQRDDLLDALDVDLVREIARLQAQRRTIAALRNSAGPLDMSPDFASVLVPLEAGRSERANRAGREQSVILDHVIAEEGHRALAEHYERLAQPELAAILLDLGQRFDRLGTQSNEHDITSLADAYVRHLGPWMREANAIIGAFASRDANALLWTHATETATPQQHRVLTEIGLRLAANEPQDKS